MNSGCVGGSSVRYEALIWENQVKTTVLNKAHRKMEGRLVEFGGFEMPVQYRSIVDEHHTVRKAAGLFDLCHMGRFEITGERAVEAVDHVVTNHVAKMKNGQIRYALVLNDAGGVRDDVLVYRMPESVLLVVNAGNRDKLLAWFGERLVRPGATLVDRSEELAMIAVQGPRAEKILTPHTRTTWVPALADLGYYKISDASFAFAGGVEGWVSRTGYTGEDGFELYVPSDMAEAVWFAVHECGVEHGLAPCGLGSRDTLRLEAGMPLYGHELGEDINPLEAGLDFGIKLKKPAGFIGRDALLAIKEKGVARRLAGFTVEGRRVAREGMGVYRGDEQVGVVTSGAPSPTLERQIALAYIPTGAADRGLEVDVRGKRAPLAPCSVPFYKRPKSP